MIAALILIAVIATPALASPATAIRTLPISVASGDALDITIQPSGCGFAGQVVETLPPGFTYISCLTTDIGVEVVGNTIKFTFLGSESFTYKVKAPTVSATTTYTFHGIVRDENKNEYPIEDNDITVAVDVPSPETYTLTMVAHGNGSTTPSVGSHSHDDGSMVGISATAASGWRFDSWGGDVANPASSSITVIMDEDKTIIANFTRISAIVYTLTMACEPSEGGSVTLSPAAGDNQYEAGVSVELTATPVEGYVFSCWDGDLSGNTNPTSITMDSDKSISAYFALIASEWTASFTVLSLNISPEQIQPDQQVDISINVTNKGEEAGEYQAALYINGQLEDTRAVDILPGSSQNVVFSITKTNLGTYSVSLGGQRGQFTVVGRASDVRLDIGSMVAIVAIPVLIAALVFVFRMVRKKA